MTGSIMFVIHLLLLISFDKAAGYDFLPTIAQDDSEAHALYALKQAFNNTVINQGWEGQVCSSNGTSSSWFGIGCTNGRVAVISLPSLGLSGSVESNVFFQLTELTYLSFKNNSIYGSMMNFTMNSKLSSIDLSDNIFEGPISSSLLNLDSLESLRLEENNLTGMVPDFNYQRSLTDFNVSYNNLSGTIPETHVLQRFNSSSFMGNQNLCGPPLSPCDGQAPNANEESKKNSFTLLTRSSLIIVFILFDVVAVILITTCCFLYKKKRKRRAMDQVEEGKKNEMVTEKGESEAVASQEMPKLTFFKKGEEFELDELLRAPADGLGKGNFGACYKAKLNGGLAVVVKRLKDVSPLTGEEFAKHMNVLVNLKHPNLLPLLAYYYSKEEKLLIHKVAPHGNLFYRLHARRGTPERIPMKWPARLSIAKGVARAMAYLHLNAKPTAPTCMFPHGNLKSSNVLLDDKDAALVTDHGFSSLVSTTIASQRMAAYKSPEYLHRRKVYPKSDVWCFGSLMLEILTGRVSDLSVPAGAGGYDLCSWVYRAVREEWTAEIFDVEIAERKRASAGMLDLLKVALRCCEKQPEKRPEMGEVAREVEEIKSGGGEVEEEVSDESWPSFSTAEEELGSMSDP